MNKLIIVLIAIVAFFFLSQSVNHTVDRHYDHLEQPPSSAELVMQSRETAPAPRRSGDIWIVLGMVTILGGGLAAILGFIYLGAQKELAAAERIKQQRLANKRPSTVPTTLPWNPDPPQQLPPPYQRNDSNDMYRRIDR